MLRKYSSRISVIGFTLISVIGFTLIVGISFMRLVGPPSLVFGFGQSRGTSLAAQVGNTHCQSGEITKSGRSVKPIGRNEEHHHHLKSGKRVAPQTEPWLASDYVSSSELRYEIAKGSVDLTLQQLINAYTKACSAVTHWHTVLWLTIREKDKHKGLVIETKHMAERWVEVSSPPNWRLEVHYNHSRRAYRGGKEIKAPPLSRSMGTNYQEPLTQVFLFDGKRLMRYDPANKEGFLIYRRGLVVDTKLVYLTVHFVNFWDPAIRGWSDALFAPYPPLIFPLDVLPHPSFKVDSGLIHVQHQEDLGKWGTMHNEWWLDGDTWLPKKARFQRMIEDRTEIRELTLQPTWETVPRFQLSEETLIHSQDPWVTDELPFGYEFPDLYEMIWGMVQK